MTEQQRPRVTIMRTSDGRYAAVCAEHGVLTTSAYLSGPTLTAALHRGDHRNGRSAEIITAQEDE